MSFSRYDEDGARTSHHIRIAAYRSSLRYALCQYIYKLLVVFFWTVGFLQFCGSLFNSLTYCLCSLFFGMFTLQWFKSLISLLTSYQWHTSLPTGWLYTWSVRKQYNPLIWHHTLLGIPIKHGAICVLVSDKWTDCVFHHGQFYDTFEGPVICEMWTQTGYTVRIGDICCGHS